MKNFRFSLKTSIPTVLFAVVMVLGGWFVAYQETSHNVLSFFETSKVKAYGTTGSYGYQQPVCDYRGICLSYQLLDYSEYSGSWRARLDFSLPNGMRGVIRKNGYEYTSGLYNNSFIYTSYELIPGQTYYFDLYVNSYGYQSYATTIAITAPYVPTVAPSYGYALPVLNSGSYASEGWIETAASGVNPWIGGWAYDNGSVADVYLYMQNTSTGEVSIVSTRSYAYRSDVSQYIENKFGITPSYVSTQFVADLSTLKGGTYRISSANYNGKSFYIHNNTPSTIEVVKTSPLVVTSPNGGESWKLGEYHIINWSDFNSASRNYNIYLQRSSDSLDLYLGSVSGTTSFIWRVGYGQHSPGTAVDARPDYRIVVRRTDGGYDVSNGDFAISPVVAPVSTPTILVSAAEVAASVERGASNVKVGRFAVAAINGPVMVTRLAVTLTASASANNFGNVKLMVNGSQVGSSGSLSSSGVIVFETGSVVVTGTTYFDIFADVVSGAGKNFAFAIQQETDIQAQKTVEGLIYTASTTNPFPVKASTLTL